MQARTGDRSPAPRVAKPEDGTEVRSSGTGRDRRAASLAQATVGDTHDRGLPAAERFSSMALGSAIGGKDAYGIQALNVADKDG